MGLIKAAIKSISGNLESQWKDFIRCEDMGMDTLMVKKTGSQGLITKDSAVEVQPGQIAVIMESGKILDATAEEGIYTFDQSTSPSFFAGQFGDVFKDMWQRFTYNGVPAKEQAVFFINGKEIIGNNFGTPAPVDYRDFEHAIPNEMTGKLNPLRVEVKCFGKYTYKIFDPALFMREYAGTADVVKKDEINDQMRTEVISTLQALLNELGNQEVPVLSLSSATKDIRKAMDENVFDERIRERGIQILGFNIESVKVDEESQAKIDEYEHNSNSRMQQGRVLDVMETAAGNANGAANGFMGLGVMNMATGGMNTAVMNNAFNPQQTAKEEKAEAVSSESGPSKFCPECGTKNEGSKFCPNCGHKL